MFIPYRRGPNILYPSFKQHQWVGVLDTVGLPVGHDGMRDGELGPDVGWETPRIVPETRKTRCSTEQKKRSEALDLLVRGRDGQGQAGGAALHAVDVLQLGPVLAQHLDDVSKRDKKN